MHALTGYDIFRNDRCGRNGGDVVSYPDVRVNSSQISGHFSHRTNVTKVTFDGCIDSSDYSGKISTEEVSFLNSEVNLSVPNRNYSKADWKAF